ncbi:MAG: helix-turn-helix transcriptional regulator [Ruminococcus sp.]|nr:helix-turn-helix transcriptional regulator [Ruminococcus sp.]
MAEFYQRMREAMEAAGLSQSEICERTKIPKSAMSQYLSGAFKPKQERTYLIARALGVSESWLMGCDTPRERNEPPPDNEQQLLDLFRQLNAEGQQIVIDCAVGLAASGRYKKTTADTVGDIA